MSRKTGELSKLILAFVVLVGVGAVLGASSFNVKISPVGGAIITAAVLETSLILGSIVLLNRRQPRRGSTGDSN